MVEHGLKVVSEVFIPAPAPHIPGLYEIEFYAELIY